MCSRNDVAVFSFFFFNDTATTEIYPLSLHDALPILRAPAARCTTDRDRAGSPTLRLCVFKVCGMAAPPRSEEHTSELQSQSNLVCRLLLEKKKNFIRLVAFVLRLHVQPNTHHDGTTT